MLYTGLPARTLVFSADIFPTKISKIIYAFLFPFGLRARLYHRLYDEPCTRDLYTGALLRPDKKHKVLIEKGVIDAEGYLLKDGVRLVLEDCWVKPDFSDVDFIKSEFHAYKQSEVIQKTASAMAKTGQAIERWFFYVMITAFVAMVIVVIIMSGAI